MYHEVKWTKERIENFKKHGELTCIQCKLLDMRVNNIKVFAQARELNVSDRTINRMIEDIKKIYDDLSKKDSVMFPPRKIKHRKSKKLLSYKNFIGNFYVTRKDTGDIISIPFNGNDFDTLEDIRKYIVEQSSDKFNTYFYDISQFYISINMDLDLFVVN